jgi:adenosylcobinamide-GDP ribazoletransferase
LVQVVWALIVLFGAAWFALQWDGIIVATVTLLVILAFSAHCRRKIGGATGDTLGATCELAETAIVVALVAVPSQLLPKWWF